MSITVAVSVACVALALLSAMLWVTRKALLDRDTRLAVGEERLQETARQLTASRGRQAELESSLAEARKQVTELRIETTELQAALQQERALHEERQRARAASDEKVRLELEQLATTILEDKSRRFTSQNQQNLEALIQPLRERLVAFERAVGTTHDRDSKDRQTLLTELRTLRELNQQMTSEANNLTRALKGSSKVRGNWGELVLERVLEHSGLTKGREFDTQVSLRAPDGKRYQPDVVLHLPEGKEVVVDAKVSLVAYERACAAETAEARSEAMAEHVASLQKHLRSLASKDYQGLLENRTLEVVLMFVPIEAALGDALEHAPRLLEEALERNVIVVSPTLLLAAVKTIHSFWQKEKQTRNAQEIAKKAGALYDKLAGFVDDLSEVGRRLGAAQSAYEKAESKLSTGRGNLLRRAQELESLGARTTKRLPSESVVEMSA